MIQTPTEAQANEQSIRADERCRLAKLLEEHEDVIGGFAADPIKAVRLVAYMLRLDA